MELLRKKKNILKTNSLFKSYSSLIRIVYICTLLLMLANCTNREKSADLIIFNGKVYSLSWADPDENGVPSVEAPFKEGLWLPDAEAIVVKNNKIIYVGSKNQAMSYKGESTELVDAKGGTVIPGLIDSHAHPFGFANDLGKIDLSGLKDKKRIIEKLVKESQNTKKGDWVFGFGYDEGNLSLDFLPDKTMLSKSFPENPVYIIGTHGFSAVLNTMALKKLGITNKTISPVGGEIVKDKKGEPNGIFLNNAVDIIQKSLPKKNLEDYKKIALYGMKVMAESGYTSVHEAGSGKMNVDAYQALENEGKSLIRVYAMIKATDTVLCKYWLEQGPEHTSDELFVVRSVKAYYDASLGVRGARMLEDYSDKPGHRGLSGKNYGFDKKLVSKLMAKGFQVGIHAIGDAGNREILDFYQDVYKKYPEAKKNRNRIEHAQVVHQQDFPRFEHLNIIASMEPPHMAEDLDWAEDRIGKERIKGAYAWRTFRKNKVRLTFNSDLTGSDHSIFYGLYAAITRKNKNREPKDGWYPGEKMTPEEALRAYTIWSAYASFQEEQIGTLEEGKLADITILDTDILNVGLNDPDRLWDGKVLMTIVNGRIVHRNIAE